MGDGGAVDDEARGYETGLVPESYLRKHDFRVVASTAYEERPTVSCRGPWATLVVRTGVLPSRGWWLACVRGGAATRHVTCLMRNGGSRRHATSPRS